MSRFQNLLQDVAEQAENPHDLADRALAGAERRRAGPGVLVAAAVSMAVVLIGGTVGTWLITNPPGISVSRVTDAEPRRISFPERARPLPKGGVAPAMLAYQMHCDRPDDAGCGWRIMTADGEHYELPTGPTGPAPDAEVTVSPSGDRLAYWRPDGRVVLHDLGTGRVKEQFGWSDVRPVRGSRYAWSADGRWLLALPCESRRGAECGSNARLLDTENRRVYGVGDGPDAELGALSNGDDPSTLGQLHASDSDVRVELDGSDQFLTYGIDPGVLREAAVDGLTGSTSPDGTRLVTVTYPDQEAGDPERARPLVSVLDVTGKHATERELLTEFWIESESAGSVRPSLLGWQDDRHLLLGLPETDSAGSAEQAGHVDDRPPRSVQSLDVQTGDRHPVLELPDGVDRIALASDRW